MPPEGAEPRPQEGGVQFLSDELSEVGRNGQLTVQFLRDDFATVSELSGKKSLLTSKNRRFVCVSAYIFLEIAVYRPVTQRFFPLSTESHR